MKSKSNAKKHIYDNKYLDGCDEIDEHTFGLIGSLINQGEVIKNKSIRSDTSINVSKHRPV